jgi:hypothetical protein
MQSKIVKYQWVVIGIFIVLICLLILQNLSLKSHSNHGHATKPDPKMASLLFQQNLDYKHLFKAFPRKVNIEDFYFSGNKQPDFVNNYLIMIFDLTVCGKCLFDGLETLKAFRERLENKNIFVLAIVGVSAKSEESKIIELHSAGDIFFPCLTVPVDELYSMFGLNQEQFVDTPFYMYTTHQFQVLNIFKPPYLDKKEFKKWIKILSNQQEM